MAEQIHIQIRKNDQVKVISGKDVGRTGRVLKVLREKSRVVVEGVSMQKRHTKANPAKNLKGGIVEREMPIHVSNVMIICENCGKATRIGHTIQSDGKKIRICRACGSGLEK